MKRILSLILVCLIVLTLVPAVHAYDAPAVSSNLDEHWYTNAQRWYHPIASHLAYEDGGYLRVECIDGALAVERYSADFEFLSGQTIELELPLYGGVYIDDDYNFVVVGNSNPDESDDVEVFRIIRYTKDWEKVDHASLYGANTLSPFEAGSLRFDRCGDMLYIRTCHKMYTSSDGLNHQANVMISVRVSDMTVTDELTEILNMRYGYISHSFNQFVRVDGSTLLAVDHGDALPRSVVLIKYNNPAGQENFFGRVSYVNALPIVDSTYHYNDTGVSVGGFEYSSDNYLIAGSAYDMSESVNLMYAHRNIFVTVTPKDDFTDGATAVHWLTEYSADDNVEVSPPHLLKLSSDSFFLTWTEDGVLKYCFLDGSGQLASQIYTSSVGALSDCPPILVDGRIVWYITDDSAPVFYTIDRSNPGTVQMEHIHLYDYQVKTAPTLSDTGLLIGRCFACEATEEFVLPVLNEQDYTMTVLDNSTCNQYGRARYIWNDEIHGQFVFFIDLPLTEHSYGPPVVVEPTCTTQGYTSHTCSVCGSNYQDNYTPKLPHSYDSYTVGKQPTTTETGTLVDECSRCYTPTTVTLPTLNTTDYTYTVTAEATCVTSGNGQYTWKDTTYGVFTFDAYIPALGHSMVGITCSRCGMEFMPFTDVPVGSYCYDPVIWAVENGITNGTTPTTFSPNAPCTRWQIVTFLWRAAGCPEPASLEHSFTDVSSGSVYYKAMLWAVEEGITNGTTATTFSPNEVCSRWQIVTFLWRFAGCPEPTATEHSFTDISATSFYRKAVLWAVEKGITNGTTPTTFAPNAPCTRGQIVTFLYRYMEK